MSNNKECINEIKTLIMQLLCNINKLEIDNDNINDNNNGNNNENDNNNDNNNGNNNENSNNNENGNNNGNENKLENGNEYKYLSLNDMTNINNKIDNIIRSEINNILDNNIKTDLSKVNVNYMDFFFNKNVSNIVCTVDFSGNFIKINNMFSKLIGYTNEEVYQKNMNNYIVKWDSVEHISETKMKCKNTYKTKNDKMVTFKWYSVTIENCYYSIGKVIEDKTQDFIFNEKYVKLDNNMTKIIHNFSSKKELASLLQVSLYKLNKIIDKKELYNNFYYVKYNDCPKNLIDIYELENF